MPGQEARRLGAHHALLDAGQHVLGIDGRRSDRLQLVVALIEMRTSSVLITLSSPATIRSWI